MTTASRATTAERRTTHTRGTFQLKGGSFVFLFDRGTGN